jgi:peptidoglycan/LPS O-acetylase OafA/YrhL
MTIHPKYRPDIDGLRAVAILAVVLFHAFPTFLSGGFIGVDVFFVISGFLISTIIFGSLEKKNFSYREFYARRVKRIFPALLFVMVAVLVMGWIILLPDEWHRLGKHAYNGLLFLLNINLMQESGYFEPAASLKPLLHLWSLCIEEQFYLIWPILAVLIWKKTRFRAAWIILFILLSFATNIAFIDRKPAVTFYFPAMRLWELWAGAFLAYLTTCHKNPGAIARRRFPEHIAAINHFRSVIGLGFILVGACFLDKADAFPGFWALLPVIGSVALIDAGPQAVINRYILSNRMMIAFGLISYPLYLWHWPLLSFAKIIWGEALPTAMAVRCVLIAIIAAALTYFWIEKPLRFSPHIHHKTRILLLGWLVVFALAMAAYIPLVHVRLDNARTAEIITATKDWTFPYKYNYHRKDGFKSFTVGEGKKAYVLLIGDSHMEQYQPRLEKIMGPETPGLIFATAPGCAPLPGLNRINPDYHCDAFYDFAHGLMKDKRVTRIVISAYWEKYFGYAYGNSEADTLYDVTDPNHHDLTVNDVATRQAFKRLALDLRASGKKIFILQSNPTGSVYDPKQMLDRMHDRINAVPVDKALFLKTASPAREAVKRLATSTHAVLIDPVEFLCGQRTCPVVTSDGKPVNTDTDHIRASYAASHAVFVDKILH